MKELLWKYLIGPIVSDAQNAGEITWQGATAYTGYNPVNTIFYAILAATILYTTYRVFQKYEVEFDAETALYSLPFVFLGGTLRFLEDAQAIPYPYNIVLITPFVYMLIAAIYVPAVTYLKNKNLAILGSSILAPTLLFALIQFEQLNMMFVALTLTLSAVLVAAYYWLTEGVYNSKPMVAMAGSQLFEGSASMNASIFHGYSPKQLLVETLNSILGPPGVLVLKMGIVVIAASIISDLEDDVMKAISFLALYSIGFGTGFRVFLRVAAGM